MSSNIFCARCAELEQALEELKQENVALRAQLPAEEGSSSSRDFLATMSHEIRTPINSIIGMTQLALDAETSPEQLEYLEIVQSSAAALLELLNEILDFSKIESGKLALEQIPFSLSSLINSLVKSMNGHAAQCGVELMSVIAPTLSEYVIGDPVRLRQVLTNLLGNAIKFTRRGGTVLIRVAKVSRNDDGTHTVLFAVSDSGIGISVENQKKIFEAFTQADLSTTRQYGGTGLGLSISSRLVQMMGGEVELKSIEGVGSTFFFMIPLPIADKRSINSVGIQSFGASGSGQALTSAMNILVVEDNIVNQKVIVRMLERLGHRVYAVNNGLEAAEALGRDPFDLILMDCQMPVMNGYDATRRIREMERQENRQDKIPIIALTASAMKGDREKCLSSGMTDYLSKPISKEELTSLLSKYSPTEPGSD